ncbi:MAG: NAD(P)-dependent oxidoreductase [Candidatus Puniceispirillum sp.]|nr:NAD(P)-dependent oxidoreductase [Candidatus Puniceispirillum sp.]MBL6774882.1 NAD(P)-dependent oxidoreductase [Candidatus Puniceispirillum sp.]
MSNRGIGFIGLGQMGLGMANNLGRINRPFYAYDAVNTATERLNGDDTIIADSVAQMAENCHLIFLCLPSAKEVNEVIFGAGGIAETALDGLAIIDNSTIDRIEAIAIHDKLANRGIAYADCPISGLPFRATDGTLTLMFGGSKSLFDRAKPQLDAMGEFIVYCGDSGAGQMMKAINNIIYDINIVALCEVLPLAVAGGLSTEALRKVVTTASSRSFAGDHFVPRMLARQFDNDFPMEDAYKDILNVQQLAIEKRAMTPLVNAMTSSYQNAIAAGFGRQPKSAIIKVYEKALGTEFSDK